jgi:glutamate formiminotransferase
MPLENMTKKEIMQPFEILGNSNKNKNKIRIPAYIMSSTNTRFNDFNIGSIRSSLYELCEIMSRNQMALANRKNDFTSFVQMYSIALYFKHTEST